MKNFAKKTPLRFAVAALVATLSGPICSGQTHAAPGSATPIVVELFTSEGCSSCPPADALLRTMDAKQPVPGAQLIVLEEHVDYWDDQGWRDPFSSRALTVRQAEYAERLNVREPYTPQMIIDGIFQFLGNDQLAIDALKKARSLPMVGVRLSSIVISNGSVRGQIEIDPVPAKADVLIALALDHAESQVLRGENGGHHLQHVAITEDLVRAGKVPKGQAFSGQFSLPVKFAPQPFRVIAIVQEPGEGKIIGAALGRITSGEAVADAHPVRN
jgi:hypothetical protein